MLTQLRMVSYVPIFRQRYAEDHTDKVVSRDVESLQTVPLPAVAMDLCVFWVNALIYISLGMNGLRYFENHWTDRIISLFGKSIALSAMNYWWLECSSFGKHTPGGKQQLQREFSHVREGYNSFGPLYPWFDLSQFHPILWEYSHIYSLSQLHLWQHLCIRKNDKGHALSADDNGFTPRISFSAIFFMGYHQPLSPLCAGTTQTEQKQSVP
jgi:hypothetical protein